MRSDFLDHLHKYYIIFLLHRLDYLQWNARLDPLIKLEWTPFQSFAVFSYLLSQSFDDPSDIIFQNYLGGNLIHIDPQFIHPIFLALWPRTLMENLLFLFKDCEFIFLKTLPKRVAYFLNEHLFSVFFLILYMELFASKAHLSTDSRLWNFICLLLRQDYS